MYVTDNKDITFVTLTSFNIRLRISFQSISVYVEVFNIKYEEPLRSNDNSIINRAHKIIMAGFCVR